MRPALKKRIHGLDELMRRQCASNADLAHKSGTSVQTVHRVRNDIPISGYLAECIMQTLCTHDFSYDPKYKHHRPQ
ncbi:MAG: hypothetical protein PHC49_18435 [Desulfuromonadaceae bacterium]|nr:hypothetical protein [Desulfuromonadaceae bacterium]